MGSTHLHPIFSPFSASQTEETLWPSCSPLPSACQQPLFLHLFGRHSWTRHQFYLQLRKDILEEKLYCNDETLLQLGVLALQAEFGSYPEEVGVEIRTPWVGRSLERQLWDSGELL